MNTVKMDKFFGWLELPTKQYFKNKLNRCYVSTENYGSLKVASDYCKISEPKKPFNAIWQHGCFKPWFMDFPDLLVYNAPNSKNKSIFVARKDEQLLLREHGYKNVLAIGLPFTYLPELSLTKKKNSLLVVPIHSLAGKPAFESANEIQAYVDYINSIKNKFSEVVACVHPGCITNGYWINQFDEIGVKWVEGATSNDANALLRMKMLFSQFEYMNTNGWGGHVAYALSCGIKLSIADLAPKYNIASLLSDIGWGNNREAIVKNLSDEVLQRQRVYLNKFYVNPTEGILDIDMGKYLIGFENKKLPNELIRLFKWGFLERYFYYTSFDYLKKSARKFLPEFFIRVVKKIFNLLK